MQHVEDSMSVGVQHATMDGLMNGGLMDGLMEGGLMDGGLASAAGAVR